MPFGLGEIFLQSRPTEVGGCKKIVPFTLADPLGIVTRVSSLKRRKRLHKDVALASVEKPMLVRSFPF